MCENGDNEDNDTAAAHGEAGPGSVVGWGHVTSGDGSRDPGQLSGHICLPRTKIVPVLPDVIPFRQLRIC